MSEHKLVQHGIKSYKIWKDPTIRWPQKLREILTEVFIIIFAVLVTLYLERAREHQQKETIKKEFLAGYRNDLLGDMKELTTDSAGYSHMQSALIRLMERSYPPDSLNFFLAAAFQKIDFVPGNSRFEALKASGHLDAINNYILLNAMFELYQKELPYLKIFGNTKLSEFKENVLTPYLHTYCKRDNKYNIINWDELLAMNGLKNHLYLMLTCTFEIKHRYGTVLGKCRKIAELINKELLR